MYHRHLRSHPAPLIAALCLSDAMFQFMGVSRFLYCGGGRVGHLEGLTALTLLFDATEASQLRAMHLIMQCFTFWSFFAYSFSTVVDISLQVDLVLTLQRPFARTAVRQIYGITAAFLFATVSAAAQVITGQVDAPINQVLFYSAKIIFFGSALYSLSLATYSFL